MNVQECEQLTLFQGDSLASLFPLPGSEAARKMTVTSGLKCSELLKNCGPLGCLARMCLASSVWHSTRCFLTWQPTATKRNALLFRLVASMPHTEENGSPLWPTILANGMGSEGQRRMLQRMVEKGMLTVKEKRQMIRGNGGKINPELLEWLMGYAKTFTEMIPTPKASSYKCAASGRYVGGATYCHNLSELVEATPRGIIGRLNPEWIEWLMGYPTGWTELEH